MMAANARRVESPVSSEVGAVRSMGEPWETPAHHQELTVSHFLLSVHTPADAAPDEMSPEQMKAGYERIEQLESEMRAAGALVFSGRLHDASEARVVNAAPDRVVTTDGPYAEAKEAIGGFYIVEADGLDSALEWAAKTSTCISMPIEVRPFFGSAAG